MHRDVKPQNVLLNGDGTAKVTDFGIARSLDVGKGVTQTGTVLGTSDYIAPEQAQGQSVGERTDVYSLGVVLYELLTGELPFKGDNFVAIAMKHINEPAPRVSARRPRRAAAPRRCDRDRAREGSGRPLRAHGRLPPRAPGVPGRGARGRRGAGRADGTSTVVLPPRPRSSAGARRSRWPLLLSCSGSRCSAGVGVARPYDTLGHEAATRRHDRQPAAAAVGARSPSRASGATTRRRRATAASTTPRRRTATDGDQTTYWPTENYKNPPSFGKPGVGLVLDAGATGAASTSSTVTSDTPGFTARIQAGDSADGPFHDVSGAQTVGASTTFELDGAHGAVLRRLDHEPAAGRVGARERGHRLVDSAA